MRAVFQFPASMTFRGTRAPGSQFARQPNPATVRRQVRLDTGGAGGSGKAPLKICNDDNPTTRSVGAASGRSARSVRMARVAPFFKKRNRYGQKMRTS